LHGIAIVAQPPELGDVVLRAAVAESPRDPDRCLALVQAYKDLNRYDEAIEAVRNDPAVVIHAANVEALRIPVDPALLTPKAPASLPADGPKRTAPALPK